MVNNSKPLISITTPCWNSAKTIERTLKSVLDQSFKDYEYIIVDGGSTDGTIEILQRYEPLFEGRMRWKSEPDNGLYNAFNKGIAQSKGQYCWNVNSDDYIEPEALTHIALTINKCDNKDSILVFGMCVDYGNGKKNEYTCSAEKIKKIYHRNWMIPHPATVVPKSIYDQFGTYDERFKICADKDWFHRVYKSGGRFEFSDEIIINFTVNGISTEGNYSKEIKDQWLFCKKKYRNVLIVLPMFMLWHWYYIKKNIERKNKKNDSAIL